MTTNTRQQNPRENRPTGTRAPEAGKPGMQSGMGQSGLGGMNVAGSSSALAGSLVFLLGIFHLFAGIAGFSRRNFYTVGSAYPYHLGSFGWGWLYVVGGAVLILTGLALFSRSNNTWARPTALLLAVLSAIANFFFLPFFPLWAFLMLATSLFAIWAITRDSARDREQQAQLAAERMGAQPHAGAYTTAPSGTYGAGQTGQRWPENVGAREESGRQWAPQDAKDTASRMGDRTQEQAQAGAGSAGQAGRSAADQAAERARQAAAQGQNRPGR